MIDLETLITELSKDKEHYKMEARRAYEETDKYYNSGQSEGIGYAIQMIKEAARAAGVPLSPNPHKN